MSKYNTLNSSTDRSSTRNRNSQISPLNSPQFLALHYHKYKLPSLLSHHQHRDKHQHNHSDGTVHKGPILWCMLGFSLKELMGEEEVMEESEEDAQLILMIKRGILAFHHGDYDLSESLLHVALRAAQEVQHEQAVTYIYDVLANLAYQRGHYAAAEKLFKSVLQRHVSAGGDVYGNVFVAVSLKLAHCYQEQQDWQNAIMGYHYCIAAQNEKTRQITAANSANPGGGDSDDVSDDVDCKDDTLVLWAMSVEQYSHLLLRLGRYTPARQHLQQALEVCRRLLGDNHLQTAVIRNDIATILCMERKFSEAVSEIEEAISIVGRYLKAEEESSVEEPQETPSAPKKVAPIPSLHTSDAWSNMATYYINLGSVQLLGGQRQAAMSSCEEGGRLAKRTSDTKVATEAAMCVEAIKLAMKEVATTDKK